MFRSFILTLAGAVLAGCASAPPPPAPEPLALNGTLDLSKPGIGIRVADLSETLVCETHTASGRLPETLSLPLACSEGRSGTLYLTKAPELRGTVTFIGGQLGDVTFAPPAAPAPPPAAPPPVVVPAIVPAPSVSYSAPPTHRATVRHRSASTGYVRAHTRRATYVRPHYRNGRYVSGHYRSGSHVRGHYRRRR
jgi:hypothetical protein